MSVVSVIQLLSYPGLKGHKTVVVMYMLADVTQESVVAGAKNWQQKNHKAYGISMSLYDQHPITGKISGRLSVNHLCCVVLLGTIVITCGYGSCCCRTWSS